MASEFVAGANLSFGSPLGVFWRLSKKRDGVLFDHAEPRARARQVTHAERSMPPTASIRRRFSGERRRSLIRQQRVEQLWSRAGETSGNRWQMRCPRKRLKRADLQPIATHGNLPSFDGKEGVDGSSPSEGSKRPANRDFVLPVLNRT
jgi:hypothetical protein